jgi:hypothetical protein
MKLRTTAGSIRLRLAQKDVRTFSETGRVEERLVINENQRFGYRLVRTDAHAATVRFERDILTISVPGNISDNWISTDQVGIEATCSNSTPEGLALLIEKDFACLKPRSGDDDLDTFPNPGIAHVC